MSSVKLEWSDYEKELLIKYFPTMGSTYCSDLLSRSKRACQEMSKKLKLKRKVNFRYENIEEFKKIVDESNTYTEVVIKLGLSPRCSGNFQTVKKYIKKYEIDISHFTKGEFQVGNTPKNKKRLDEVLIENSYFSRNNLKRKLYNENIKEKKCEICGMSEDWYNGTKIVHILDHINGNSYDNRIENLRIICPNCNSTLDTNCRGDKVKKIYDSEKDVYRSEKTHKKCFCGKVILKGSKFCSKCNGENQRKFERPDLETLLQDVKELGYVGAGKKYGITDNGLRKWIISYQEK
jgi:hypothetical protein